MPIPFFQETKEHSILFFGNSKNLSIPASLASVFTPLAYPFIIIKSIFIPPGGWIRFYFQPSNPGRHVGSALGSLRYQGLTAIWHMLLIKYSLIFQSPGVISSPYCPSRVPGGQSISRPPALFLITVLLSSWMCWPLIVLVGYQKGVLLRTLDTQEMVI